jgi:nucleotide-binding universal stress UspA family protein
MTKEAHKQVVCAVRIGPESRATVSRAIDLALENNARLTFFHVVDAEFLGYATVGPLSVVYQELIEMGKFAMLILCDRAQRRGVSQVDYVLREGNIRKNIMRFVAETHATVMVMGQPTRSPGRNTFKQEEFETFIARLEKEGDISIVLAERQVNG